MDDFLMTDDFGIDRMMGDSQPQGDGQVDNDVQAEDALPSLGSLRKHSDPRTELGACSTESPEMLSRTADVNQRGLLKTVENLHTLLEVYHLMLLIKGSQIPVSILRQLAHRGAADKPNR
ncbi:hypothetical protein CcaCcLH18_11993 [Colletotrichum camelliae]|nr:hypothetical protein CcaCcLH18_11993 [Colletotrichum camelliae]